MPFEAKAHLTCTAARLLNPQVTALNYIQKQKQFIEKLKNEFQTGGIFCLTETNDATLMWSYYADSHKGICIGYRRSEAYLLGSDNCRQVVYGEFRRFGLAEPFGALTTREKTIGEMIFEKMVLVKNIY